MRDDRKSLLLELLKFRSIVGLSTSPAQFRALWNSASHDQIHIINDKYERLAGYVAWANFTKESILLMALGGVFPQNIGDWSEGRFLFVLDVAARKGVALDIKRLLEQLPQRKYVLFVRRGFIYVIKPREGRKPVFKFKLPQSNDLTTKNLMAGSSIVVG